MKMFIKSDFLFNFVTNSWVIGKPLLFKNRLRKLTSGLFYHSGKAQEII